MNPRDGASPAEHERQTRERARYAAHETLTARLFALRLARHIATAGEYSHSRSLQADEYQIAIEGVQVALDALRGAR